MNALRPPILAALLALVCAHAARAECGGADEPCTVPSGSYNAVAPSWSPGDPARPAIVHFHGAGGSGADALGDRGMVAPALARGYVFIAPNGLPRGNLRSGWRFRPQDTGGRDELAFIRDVMADATTRFHIDRARVLLTGFSIGGSLVWYLACRAPGEFAAYAPVSGGFWEPQPQACAGPIKMLHTHGWQDRTVPLEGRPLGRLGIRQGDIFQGLQTWRAMNGCANVRPDEFDVSGVFWRRRWTTCAPGTALEFALHSGGHEIPAEWAPMAIAWFQKQTAKTQAAR
jgi:polyhydroxybutyrate depolymerase